MASASAPHHRSPLQLLQDRELQRTRARYISRTGTDSKQLGITPDIAAHYSVERGSEEVDANRYVDICPYDRNCVRTVDTRYLNASWVLERHGAKWWIATQAPLPATFHPFLSLFLDAVQAPTSSTPPTHIRTIVQLTRLTEGGTTKADAYIPPHIGKPALVYANDGRAPLTITLDASSSIPSAACTLSVLTIRDTQTNTSRQIKHLLYDAWPDHGVPSTADRATLLEFIKLVDSTNRGTDAQDPPIVVGCSAGVGRTGTFIALSSLLRTRRVLPPATNPTAHTVVHPSPLGALPSDDPVITEVDFLREQRPCMVQRQEQIMLIYDILRTIPSNP
ncbi:phosphatases II [Cylindrobasidium torrendii FP15055 ss-10]|uniref:Phosphatases II n=1 Tax=Cylindrobasidium torrendii FP15055 ss-10 TaxID=1314674 RepID=A0A0D7BQ73_9AGAR|nr:phosphatases II [Cylindrobasidium torrendii FP15055 ss-10]